MATESTYDVMIFDVMLPDGDGYSLCRDLRAAGNWSAVMFLTARDANRGVGFPVRSGSTLAHTSARSGLVCMAMNVSSDSCSTIAQ